jgi:hypothetical protein
MYVGIKDKLTPLVDSGLLDDSSVKSLKRLSITTVEELVGVLESDMDAVGNLLGKSEPELEYIERKAMRLLDERYRAEFEAQKGVSYPTGASPPPARR